MLAAWRLARHGGWWYRVVSAMQGLNVLYMGTGRNSAWRRLVEAVTPDFIDPVTDAPLPGREENWNILTQYRVDLARDERNLPKAERLEQIRVDWNRERAQSALAIEPKRRDDAQRNAIRSLGSSIHELGEIQRLQADPACAATYREAFDTAEAIGETAGQAICAFNLGIAYTDVDGLCDFDEAERWLKQSLDLHSAGDASGRGKVLGQLGKVSLLRFKDALAKRRPEEECLRLINAAVQSYLQSLQMLPESDVFSHGVIHNQLGSIYHEASDIDRALKHYQHAIRHFEQADDIFHAGVTRRNVAIQLLKANRFDDAHAYAEAALTNFRSFGDRAAEDIQKTERLIARIHEAAANDRGKS